MPPGYEENTKIANGDISTETEELANEMWARLDQRRTRKGIGQSTEPCGTPGSHFVDPDTGSESLCFVLRLILIRSDTA